ncbi:hypothetical protein ACTXT7_003313 [Hymenolepis weldensis]
MSQTHSPVIECISTEQSDLDTYDPNCDSSSEDFSSFVSEHESETNSKEDESTISPSVSHLNPQNDQISNQENALELYSEKASVSVEASPSPIKKTQSSVLAPKLPNRKNLPLNRSRSYSSAFTASYGNTPITDTESVNNESEIGIADLSEGLRLLSRDARFRSIRPLWRDPNSRPLPSDEMASVEAMLREYNQLLIKAEKNESPAAPKIAVRRPYHSTLNRWRQQERIQMENFYLADRLRNIRPSPEISREILLKRYKQYFITPVTAQSNHPSSYDADFSNLSSSVRIRPRCSSARPISRSSLGTPRPLTGIASSGRTSSAKSSVRNDPPPISIPLRPSSRMASGINTPHSREVLNSLDSVRRALHEHRLGYAQSGENKKDVEWRGFIAHFSVLVKSLAIKYKTTLGCGDLDCRLAEEASAHTAALTLYRTFQPVLAHVIRSALLAL